MRDPSTFIQLNNPCHEDIASMSPTERGRYCTSCQVDVIDFSRLSDAEVLNILNTLKGQPMCGMFTPQQLNRPLVQPAAHQLLIMLSRKKIAAALLLYQSLVTAATAQVKTATKTEQTATPASTGDSLIVIKGRVLDAYSQEPVAGVRLYTDYVSPDTVTDAHGYFEFHVQPTLRSSYITISHIGTGKQDSFTIENKHVRIDSAQKVEVILYRYMGGTIEATVKTYKRPLVDHYYTLGGFITTASGPDSALHSSHPTVINMWKVWDLFAKPFKRKKHHDKK